MQFQKIKIFFSSSRLQKKFLLFFLLTGIIPLILMGLVGLYVVNRTHRTDVDTLEKQLASFKTTEIQKFISDTVGLFQLRVGYEEYAEIELSQQQYIADKMLEENSAIQEVAFISVYGKETVKALKDNSVEKILEDKINSPDFGIAVQGGDYLSPVLYTVDGPVISVASPVYNQNNQIIAVLTGSISLSPIQDFISNGKIGNSGYLYLVDVNGTIIAHPQKSYIKTNLIRQPIVADVLNRQVRTALDSDAIYQSYFGNEVIGSGSLIPKLNWGIIVEWPFSDAQEVIGFMISQLIIFSLLTLILILIIASLVAYNLIKPISILKEGAALIGSGDFDHPINIKTGDEIEELGHSLNKMAVSLKALEELKEIKLKAKYLAESLKKEQELSNLKNQFITMTSHQLNTPLAVINWTLETIKEPNISREEFNNGVKAIDQSRKDILAMVTDLLVVSEMGFSYKKTKPSMMDLKASAQEFIKAYQPQLAEKHLEISVESSTDNTSAEVGAPAMQKVLENLIDNAICYSNDGGKIKIEFSGDDNQLTFKITDNGIGIPLPDQPSIFKEFFRAKNSTIKKNSGTGLGLFISKNIIDGHNGTIGFTSEENKGASVFFTIPRK